MNGMKNIIIYYKYITNILQIYCLFLALVEHGDTIFEYTDFIADIIVYARIDDTVYSVGREVGLSFDFHF